MDRQELLSLHTDTGTQATIDPTGPLRCRSNPNVTAGISPSAAGQRPPHPIRHQSARSEGVLLSRTFQDFPSSSSAPVYPM